MKNAILPKHVKIPCVDNDAKKYVLRAPEDRNDPRGFSARDINGSTRRLYVEIDGDEIDVIEVASDLFEITSTGVRIWPNSES